MTNFFVSNWGAKDYAESRPYFHPLVAAAIRRVTGVDQFDRVLDVGCGTGQSSLAVSGIATSVDAVDPSPEMLAQAVTDARITYHEAPAEQLPFGPATFDLVTAGLSFHWFHQPRFLREAHRVLRESGWLVVYNSWFTAEVEDHPEFEPWFRGVHLSRFPTPPRDRKRFDAESLAPYAFTFVAEEAFDYVAEMSLDQVTSYLMSQSNVLACVVSGDRSEAVSREWIRSELSRLLGGQRLRPRFGGLISFAQANSA